jgi:hypothetical protein
VTLGTVIDAPQATQPRVGLLASAIVDNVSTEAAWGQGLSFAPEGCGGGGVVDVCESGAKEVDDNPAIIDYRPFAVWAGDRCSTFGFGARDYAGRATRQLLATQSYRVEREFMFGDLASASSYPNRYLDDGNDDVVTGANPDMALAALEEALGETLKGAPGMIHATRGVVSIWNKAGALRREGSLTRTINDTIVVAGAGYAGSLKAYGTELVAVRLGPIRTIPDADAISRVDFATNFIEVRAERIAGVIWPGCAQVSVAITV